MEQSHYQRFTEITGIEFRRPALLHQAFIHRSYVNELDGDTSSPDNERLEFLGDAILGFVMSDQLFHRYPDEQEGELTRLRSALVRKTTLARVAQKLHLGDFLRLGRGEEESGGRTRGAILCATFEAVLGAIYLDRGVDAAREFALAWIGPELERVEEMAVSKDAKSRLQEYAQNTFGSTPRYKTIDSSGPDHNKVFIQQVAVDKRALGLGEGRSKQEADQSAAAMALFRMDQPAPEYEEDTELLSRYILDEPPVPPVDADS